MIEQLNRDSAMWLLIAMTLAVATGEIMVRFVSRGGGAGHNWRRRIAAELLLVAAVGGVLYLYSEPLRGVWYRIGQRLVTYGMSRDGSGPADRERKAAGP